MSASQDLLWEQLGFTQGSQGPSPQRLASDTTIAPTTGVFFVSGTAQINTITPPITGYHVLCAIFTDVSPGTTLTTGNITQAVVPTSKLPTFFVYDPDAQTYTGGTTNLT